MRMRGTLNCQGGFWLKLGNEKMNREVQGLALVKARDKRSLTKVWSRRETLSEMENIGVGLLKEA